MYYVETIFDAAYLVLIITLGAIMLLNANGRGKYSLFGAMAVLLGAGDAFHLVPRIYSMWSPGGFEANAAALGIGKLITSVTMTVFYVLLYYVWRRRYGKAEQKALHLPRWGLPLCALPCACSPKTAGHLCRRPFPGGFTATSRLLLWAL